MPITHLRDRALPRTAGTRQAHLAGASLIGRGIGCSGRIRTLGNAPKCENSTTRTLNHPTRATNEEAGCRLRPDLPPPAPYVRNRVLEIRSPPRADLLGERQ